jgi:5-methylthioadenosine/S-adenosylhomocysteine deaminase
MLILTARYVLPVSRPPIRDGALLIEGPSIRAVEAARPLQKAHPGVEVRDLGEALLLPGLVNVHTHLELTGLRGKVPRGGPFVDWVLHLLERKRGLSWDAYAPAVEEGIVELIQAGTTCVGDVSSVGVSFAALEQSGLRGVVYREVLGLDDRRAEGIAEMPFAHIQTLRQRARGTRLEMGISPHAPYSVSPRLLMLCQGLQRKLHLKAAIHVAESEAEVEYFRSGTGAIRTRLLPATGWGDVPPPIPGGTSLAYLAACGFVTPASLLVHAVHLTESDLETVARGGSRVAHCPRSNATLGVGRAPLKAFRDRKIPVGLGTDSLASNGSLSLWDEIRFAHREHGGLLSPADWIAMATFGGAQALHLEQEIGTLEQGKRADLTAVEIDQPVDDPWEYLLHEAGPEKVILTMVDGITLYEREPR